MKQNNLREPFLNVKTYYRYKQWNFRKGSIPRYDWQRIKSNLLQNNANGIDEFADYGRF